MMFKIFVALATIILVARGQKDIDSEWNDYVKNQKLTESTDKKINAQAKARFAVVHDRIKKHNDDSNSSYKMGHNKFSHMTDDEMSNFYGLKPAKKLKETSHTNSDKNFLTGETSISSKVAEMRQAPLPSSIDHRNHKCMQPIKNQQQCGSCYAFGVVATFEFAYCRVKNEAVMFSEQQIVDCLSFGCGGGMFQTVYDYIGKNGPLSKSSTYPYTSGGVFQTFGGLRTGKPGTCTIKDKNQPYNPPFITYSHLSHYDLPTRVAMIKRVLADNGLVAVAMRVTKWTFPFYRSGVFADEPCKGEYHHAVVIVGYNDNQDKKEKYPYWIIRNSWGSGFISGWGMSGYGYIRSGANICGIEDNAMAITSLDGTSL